MIAFLEGLVAEVRDSSVVVQSGPVGVEVFAPRSTLSKLVGGDRVRLHTHLVVKEDLLALYGFHEPDLLELFKHLITVSKVGPKLGLAILSALPGAVVARAIVDGDAALLASSPGVGKRTAERIILELSGKLPENLAGAAAAGSVGASAGGPVTSSAGRDAVDALVALGYRESRIKQVVAELLEANPDEAAESLIRKALGRLR